MIINKDKLLELSACESGYKNFIKYHTNFSGSVAESLALSDVPYSDKIWLIKNVVSKDIYNQWTTDCLQYIVNNYEEAYLNGEKLRGQLNIALNNVSTDLGRQSAEAFRDLVCSDYPAQENINLNLLINLL
jgi:hypothetical protein